MEETTVKPGRGQLERARQTHRISLELAIRVSGTDAAGQSFSENSRTLVLSRHGAKIVLGRMLVPEQEITVGCPNTPKESDARVVGLIGQEPQGFQYGIGFLEKEVNVWDIEFPPLAECEKAVARVLLECSRCHTKELTYLNEFEAEVFDTNKCISRPRKRCTDMGMWKQSSAPAPDEQPPLPVESLGARETPQTTGIRTENERKDIRVGLKLTGCIRGPQCGQGVVATENVSRGGLRFKSSKRYNTGWVVEVAVPFSKGASNIFVPARVEHREGLPTEGLTLYGLSCISPDKALPKQTFTNL